MNITYMRKDEFLALFEDYHNKEIWFTYYFNNEPFSPIWDDDFLFLKDNLPDKLKIVYIKDNSNIFYKKEGYKKAYIYKM